ncbi:hypothetical protein [Cerasicoccus frondis]|uniref:hypothetical protein n=1 Tax=Cerasicoccus frondis TaxID=490090 RepID=UPI002852C34F|nr:hypothetical protein [Cerasicoccus frondis]
MTPVCLKSIPPEKSSRDRGFALVIALSLMAMIFLLLMGLAVTTQIELGSTTASKKQTEARQNALFGLNVALGNLQQQLGADQRTSASPVFLQPNLDESSSVYHWSVVWDTKELNDDGTPNPNYGKDLGWLVSGYENFSSEDSGEKIPPVGSLLKADGEPTDPTSTVVLVGSGSTNEIANYVAAPKVDIGTTGEYAYWIADEGQKADVNLTSRAERGETAYPDNTPNVTTRMELSAPSRYGAQVIDGLETLIWEGDSDLAKAVSRTASTQDMKLADPSLNSGNSIWGNALKDHFHDVTYNSLALQTNTRQGGLKKDLSLLFELDDADFALTPYSGNTNRPEFTNWDRLPPTDGGNYIDPANNDQVSYLFKQPVPKYGENAFIRGPTWHKLRDFYRLYKDVKNNNVQPSVAMRPFGPSAEDIGSKGNEKGYYATMESDNGGDIRNSPNKNDNFLNTTVTVKNGGHSGVKVTRLTKHEVMPIMNRVIYIFSLYEDQGVPKYNYIAETEDGSVPKGGKFEKADGSINAISLVIEPVVCLWNPYNVAIEFQGGLRIRSEGSFGFLFSLAPTTLAAAGQHLPSYQAGGGDGAFNGLDKDILSIPQITCELAATRRTMDGGFLIRTDLILGDDEASIVLEPGEVRFFSDPNTTPTPYNELNKVPDENTRAIHLQPGFNKQGGFILGRRTNLYHEPHNNGIIHQISASSSQPMELNFYPWTGFEDANNPWGDLRSKESIQPTTTLAYVPESELQYGGSLIDTDTTLQYIAISLEGPKNGNTKGKLHHLLYGENGNSGPFPLVVDPSTIGSYPNRKMPFLYMGLYQNPVQPDLALVPSPSEFIGTMSPFSGNVDTQFSHGVNSVPYSYQMGAMSNYTDIQELDDRGFFGEGYSSASENHLVVSEIPTYPMRSLATFQHAHIADSAYMPGQAIGNSWTGGAFNRDEIIGDHVARYTQYDLSYLSNQALFDEYFFSSLTPQMNLVGDVKQSKDLSTTLTGIVESARSSHQLPQLSNERMQYVGTPDVLDSSTGTETTEIVQDLSAIDGFSKTAQYFAIEGGFNVNSLSVDAWDAFLASTLGVDYTYLDPISGYATEGNADLTIFPRATLPNGSSAEHWRGPKGLDDTQRRALAQAIVNEVKARGPYLSLSDFVNREIVNSDTGNKGAIQAAIDSLDVNDAFLYEKAYADAKGYFNDEYLTAYTGVGLPQYLTQADVLTPLAPYLSARSDTFVIRSYGNVKNALTNSIESEAVIEAVVRRIPEFVDGDSDSPETPLTQLTSESNKQFGRRFEIVSARWLSKGDI